MGLLRWIAKRCETHDRSSYTRTRQLEEQLGMTPSPPPTSLSDQLCNPELIDCGHTWCRTRGGGDRG